jgi:hypothetical protein
MPLEKQLYRGPDERQFLITDFFASKTFRRIVLAVSMLGSVDDQQF